MTQLDISNAVASESFTATSIPSKNTDGINSGSGDTEYINDKWTEQWGYFNDHSELKAALLMKAIFNVGGGYKTEDSETKVILEHISGMGKDTFQDILFNMEIIRRVGRDSFAHIIRDEDTGTLLNLKPLNPGSIKMIIDKYGILKSYKQISRIGEDDVVTRTFKPEEILHFSNNRLADQIHGISDIESLDKTLLAEIESFDDTRKVMQRTAKPFIIFKLKTDNVTKINALKAKVDSIRNNNDQDLWIPDDEDILSYEIVQMNPSQVLLQWRDDLRKKFYRAIGLPELIIQSGDSTESGGKVGSLHFGQIVERDQKYIENQIWEQLQLKINLIPPETLAQQLQSDQAKDGGDQQMNMQPSDMMAGAGR